MNKDTIQKVQDFSNKTGQTMVNLAERWKDEKEYEDIEEYRKVMEPHATAAGIVITKMVKAPFGMEFTIDNEKFRYVVQLRKQAITNINHIGKA